MKSRIIGIGDYFSQSVLTPFHKLLASVLDRIPNDFTNSHEKGFERVRQLTVESDECHSLDLSAATDRLPVKAQGRMIGILLGNSYLGDL